MPVGFVNPFLKISGVFLKNHSLFIGTGAKQTFNSVLTKWQSNYKLINKCFNISRTFNKQPLNFRTRNLIKFLRNGCIGCTSCVAVLHFFFIKGSGHALCRNVEVPHTKCFEPPTDAEFPYSEFFWKYLVPELFALTLAVIAALVGAAMNMKIPAAIGDLINLLNDSLHHGFRDPGVYYLTLKGPVFELIKLYVIQGFTTFAYISCLSYAGENIASKMRKDLFRSYLQQDVAFHDQHKTGMLIDRLTSDIQDFKSSFKLCVSQGLKSSTQTVGCIAALYTTSPKLTIALGGTIPIIVLTGTLIGSSLRKLSKVAQQHAANATAKANEIISNFRTVRAFANESYEDEKYGQLVSSSSGINQSLGIGIGLFQGLTNIALNGIVLGVIYAGGYLVMNNEINPGQLMSFLVSAQMIQRSLASLSVLFGSAVRGVTAGARAFEYIHLIPEHRIYEGRTIPYHSLLGHLQFHNVHFTYPHRPDHTVLNGVDLDIKPLQKVALCGLSGAGKSTVAALAERFYEPSSGKITLDGININELDPSWLRGQAVGFINQEPVLFSGTIEENIRYGKHDATDQQVIDAARLANAHDFIEKFPSGYNTIVGERGLALSGGQKQRIAIARALLKNPSILILDEATSALDAESERLVQDALDHVTQSRTTLVIAHRLSTIKNADLIAVMKDGKVVEMGTHNFLRKQKGIYAELIRLQESDRKKLFSIFS